MRKDTITSSVVLALVGVLLGPPGSLLIGAILRLMARIYDIFQKRN